MSTIKDCIDYILSCCSDQELDEMMQDDTVTENIKEYILQEKQKRKAK